MSKRGSASRREENCVSCTAMQQRGAAEEQNNREGKGVQEKDDTQLGKGMEVRDSKRRSQSASKRENAHSKKRT